MTSVFVIIGLSLFISIIILLLFLWAGKKEQFDDIEGPKYRMLDDDEIDEEPADES